MLCVKKEDKKKVDMKMFNKDDVKDIVSMYDSYKSAKGPTVKKWKRIKSLYDGTFWDLFKDKVKDYTLIPDTNYIEYVTTAYVNSIYSGTYIPEAVALNLESVDEIDTINAFIEYTWFTKDMKKKYITYGNNVTLYNMQPVKIYLDEDKNEVDLETISPFSIFLDPSVSDFKEGQAVFISKETNIYSLLKDKRFKKTIKRMLDENKGEFFNATDIQSLAPDYERFTTTGNKTVSVLEYYIKKEGKIKNGFIVNRKYQVYEKELILEEFPIEILYQRQPDSNPYGTPLIYKILNSYITLNLLDSMDATQPYLAQNRPKFFDLRSRINPRAFKDYAGVPGATFPLFGEPSKAIHYQDVQFIPDTTTIKKRLEDGIFHITGVDPAYKGRQTNSITTTGGIEAQQARVIMLTDNAPLVALESFIEGIAKQFLDFNIMFNDDVVIPVGTYLGEETEKVFKDLKDSEVMFVLESKPYLPMTKETIFETMKQLYEMQGQYQFQVPLIMEEDLVEELPISAIKKHKIKQRLSSEKQANAALKKRETLLTFASLFQQLTASGMDDETAAEEALNIMDQEEMAKEQDPSLGVNPSAMPPRGGMPGLF